MLRLKRLKRGVWISLLNDYKKQMLRSRGLDFDLELYFLWTPYINMPSTCMYQRKLCKFLIFICN